MNKKKVYSFIALLCIVIALMMYLILEKENGLHDFFWIPLVLGAVFLFAAKRVK
jgi:hypothetical protein